MLDEIYMEVVVKEKIATISRTRLEQRDRMFAWKWIYDVRGMGIELKGFDRLASAVKAAKRHGAGKIVREWDGLS